MILKDILNELRAIRELIEEGIESRRRLKELYDEPIPDEDRVLHPDMGRIQRERAARIERDARIKYGVRDGYTPPSQSPEGEEGPGET